MANFLCYDIILNLIIGTMNLNFKVNVCEMWIGIVSWW